MISTECSDWLRQLNDQLMVVPGVIEDLIENAIFIFYFEETAIDVYSDLHQYHTPISYTNIIHQYHTPISKSIIIMSRVGASIAFVLCLFQ